MWKRQKNISRLLFRRCLFQRMAPTSVGIHSNITFNLTLLHPFPFQVQAYLESVPGMYNTSHWPSGAPWYIIHPAPVQPCLLAVTPTLLPQMKPFQTSTPGYLTGNVFTISNPIGHFQHGTTKAN